MRALLLSGGATILRRMPLMSVDFETSSTRDYMNPINHRSSEIPIVWDEILAVDKTPLRQIKAGRGEWAPFTPNFTDKRVCMCCELLTMESSFILESLVMARRREWTRLKALLLIVYGRTKTSFDSWKEIGWS
jgi:hypothetical protein